MRYVGIIKICKRLEKEVSVMKISLSSTSVMFSKHKNNIISELQDKVNVTNKEKKAREEASVIKNLDQISNYKEKSDNESVYQILHNVKLLYEPIQHAVEFLSSEADAYEQDTNELQRSDLTKEERTKIQSDLNFAKQSIEDTTSSYETSELNKYISNYANPHITKLETKLKGNIDNADMNKLSEITLQSMEDLGLSNNKDVSFETKIKEIKTASTFWNNKMSVIDDINKKYENSTILKLKNKVDTYV